MARPAAQAVAGFVPFPTDLLPSLASLVECGAGDHCLVDPCAGEGEAVFAIARHAVPPVWTEDRGKTYPVHRDHIYTCEMEATRFEALRKRDPSHRHRPVHGDAFRLKLGRGSDVATVLFLNPPFEPDRRLGRAEEKWLRRFGPMLAAGGALLFVLPFYALHASAETLAREFADLACFRVLPWPDEYKRVVLVARRRTALLEADPALVARVQAWSADPLSIPELPAAGPAVIRVDGQRSISMPHDAWTLTALDERALREVHTPWHATDRGGRLQAVPNTMPEGDLRALLSPRFLLGTVPRPAHLAAGLASGVLSGARLAPNDPASGLPPILVRGTFARRFLPSRDKLNKDGEKVAEEQVQVPELELVALDLQAGTFHTLKSSVEQTGARRVAEMTAGDLLASYGRDLTAALRERCPAIYDHASPGAADTLPAIPGARTLYTAQEHTARACLRLLRRFGYARLLGEIGTGKTTCSLRAMHALGAPGAIVMVPPHVVSGFEKQVPSILPGARVVVLRDVVDAARLLADEDVRFTVAILSRETAKLGHPWAGVATGRCPKCGASISTDPDDLAKRRARCEAQRWEPTGPIGLLAARLALAIHRAAPGDVNARAFVPGRIARQLRARSADVEAAWSTARPSLRVLLSEVMRLVGTCPHGPEALAWLVTAIGDRALVAEMARTLFVGSLFDPRSYGEGDKLRDLARGLLALAGDAGAAIAAELRTLPLERAYYDAPLPWASYDLARSKPTDRIYFGDDWYVSSKGLEAREGGPAEIGSITAACRALHALVRAGEQQRTAPCGEPLFGATPEMERENGSTYEVRKYPVAHFLAKRCGKALRARGWGLIVDEAHEYASENSAQALASQQLLGLGLPTIVMTGSVMNGYADSLFNLLWWTGPEFRAEFDRRDRPEFVRRYGYIKQLVEQRDEKGQRVAFGTFTDRVETVTRESGQAPGVLPTLLLRYLLTSAATLQMTDIEHELPPARDIPLRVRAEGDLLDRYRTLERKLLDQIRRDRFQPDLAGRLFGQLAELPSALDRLTSDITGPTYEIAYPPGAGTSAGKTVVAVETLPADTVTPKEAAVLATVESELAEGRNVVVLAWHLDVIPRLARLLGALGKTAVLDAAKVPPSKRDAWIETQIGKGVRVLVLNPVCVATGINSMVPYFSTDIWYENPACNPQILRQTKGRTRRIGQRFEKRSYFPVYEGTAQEVAYRLLLHKAGIGEAADGLDATAALQAAGVGAVDLTVAQDIGRALFEALTKGEGLSLAA